MKTLAIAVALISGDLELYTSHPVDCAEYIAAWDEELRDQGVIPLQLYCEYTAAPVASPVPLARPENY